MKKVISLALAMAMALSMTSMAYSLTAVTASHGNNPTGDDGQMLPGEEYHLAIDALGVYGVDDTNQTREELNISNINANLVTSKNFSVSADWSRNSAVIGSVKFDGDHDACLILTIKENYTIDELKDLEGTITLKAKKEIKGTTGETIAKGTEYEMGIDGDVDALFNVANNVEDIDGGDNRDDATAIDVEDNTIYNVSTSGWFDFGGDGDRLSSVMVRLPEDKQVFAYWNEDAIEEIEDKYYDADADLSYINFVARPNLGRNAEIAIQGDYSDQYYLYEVVNGDLEEVDAEFTEEDGLFTFTASRLGAYVISDKELVAEADEPADTTDEPAADDTTTQNPDTGANDVVGVAVALAAVSLVAAGAVSLKK